uniref:uncharacterized protein LOC120332525 n=1 Tax=Styela clava TaxID=7725 RepID=UPI001939CD06|nr:uncharacterized protein LOC120332525 [Styela clava]
MSVTEQDKPEDSLSQDGVYVMSAWGKRQIVLNGYLYRKQKVIKHKSYWNCVSEAKYKCKAKIHVSEDGAATPTITRALENHCHDQLLHKIEERLAVSRLKMKVLESGEPVAKAMRKFVIEEPIIAEKGEEKVRSAMRKVRRRVRQSQRLSLENSEESNNTKKKSSKSKKDATLVYDWEGISNSPSFVRSGFMQNLGSKYKNSSSESLIKSDNLNSESISNLPNLQVEIQVPEPYSENDSNMSELSAFEGSLQGKVILVAGASSGIGKAIAEAVARAGAHVCVGARRQDKLAEVCEKIDSEGGIVHQYELDVTDRAQFSQVVKTIEELMGPIDILINNAGCMFYTHMHNAMMDDWDKMININCRGVTNGIGCVLPGMVERGKGHIVNTSSDAGRRGFPGLAVYSATKFFVEGLSQSLRQEVKDKGVRVTCIQPGDVATEIGNYTRDLDAQVQYNTMGSASKILDPEDIGRAVLYALTQPDHVGVNEILIEPTEAPI